VLFSVNVVFSGEFEDNFVGIVANFSSERVVGKVSEISKHFILVSIVNNSSFSRSVSQLNIFILNSNCVRRLNGNRRLVASVASKRPLRLFSVGPVFIQGELRIVMNEIGAQSGVFLEVVGNGGFSKNFSEFKDFFGSFGTEGPDRGSSVEVETVVRNIFFIRVQIKILGRLKGFNSFATLSLAQNVAGSDNVSEGNGVLDLLNVIFSVNDEKDSQLVQFDIVVLESSFFSVGHIEDFNP